MATQMKIFKVGDKVRVPYGVSTVVPGEVIEVWGDRAGHMRVALWFGDGEEPSVLLLKPSDVLTA